MQFLYALEQQFHMNHLFKHMKICKTSHNQDFFLPCVNTIASDHGSMVIMCHRALKVFCLALACIMGRRALVILLKARDLSF